MPQSTETTQTLGLPRWLGSKILPAVQETWVQSWSGRSPGGRHGNTLQYSCLEDPMDRGAWWAIAYGLAKSWT